MFLVLLNAPQFSKVQRTIEIVAAEMPVFFTRHRELVRLKVTDQVAPPHA